MARRSDVLNSLSGLGAATSRFGQMIAERQRLDSSLLDAEQNRDIAGAREQRESQMFTPQLTAAQNTAEMSGIQLGGAKRDDAAAQGVVDAFSALEQQDQEAGWGVLPEEQKANLPALKAQYKLMNRVRQKNGKSGLTVQEFAQSLADQSTTRTREGQEFGAKLEDLRAGTAKTRKETELLGQPNPGEGTEAAQLTLSQTFAELDRLKEAAQAIKDGKALPRITGVMGKFPNYPGGEAANTEADLKTLKSQIAFNVLQNMRNASKTGGALGQVSNLELGLLQNNLAALDTDQSPGKFQESLQKVIDYAEGSKNRLSSAYQATYGGGALGAPAGPQDGSMQPQGGDEDSQAVQWAKQNPDDPRAAQILRMNGL